MAEKKGQDMGSKQLLKKVSCRECQGEVPVHFPATRRCSGLRGETSMSGGPQLMTLQLTKTGTVGDFFSANRKKADARKTGGGRAPPPLTEAEALALSQNFGRTATEGILGGSSSSEPTPQDTSAFITYLVTDEECEETLCAAFTEGEPERPVEGMAGQQQEGPSTSTAQIDTLPVKDIYKIFLLKKFEKTDKEIQFLDRQMRRADLEIELLEHKLEVGAWSQVKVAERGLRLRETRGSLRKTWSRPD
ncbi:uncharacterized protein LOC117828305 [Notolabrus celidotus]|uniref:uncharacterized protein LOC117828305 n=1 Tax=Notolabrus celidotus TaxID=1203425 RepID=UPI00148FDC02|nr:uncharacterized protein LOC117828305 [Notolabrus celidotus]